MAMVISMAPIRLLRWKVRYAGRRSDDEILGKYFRSVRVHAGFVSGFHRITSIHHLRVWFPVFLSTVVA